MAKKKRAEAPAEQEEAAPSKPAASSGMELFSESAAAAADRGEQLSFSERFAKKYNERKDKEELARARRILADEDLDSSASDEELEDETAELLTPKVEHKIFETLLKIKSRDPAIYDKERAFFDDADFEDKEGKAGGKKDDGAPAQKKVRYKEFLRDTLVRDGADAFAREEEEFEDLREARKKMKTPREEQRELQENMISAGNGTTADDDDDFFTLKEKTAEERQREDETFRTFSKIMGKSKGEDIIANYWKSDEDLDSTEQFLRDYIVNKSWLETTSMQAPDRPVRPGAGDGEGAPDVDENEDEQHLEDADNFEAEYNFRHEAEEGKQIQGHARFPEASVRQKTDKRKLQRKGKEERQKAEKIRRTEELKRLKNMKKNEIMRRLQQIKEVTGNTDSALGHISLDDDFDGGKHDAEMAGLLGEGYDEREETMVPDDLLKAPDGCDELDVANAAEETLQRNLGKKTKKNKGPGKAAGAEPVDEGAEVDDGNTRLQPGDENVEVDEPGDEPEDADPELWWRCDCCQRGIPGGKKRFDCTVCEDFTLCVKCFRIRRHPHKFVRRRVPDSNMPPEDVQGHGADSTEMQQVLDEYFHLDYEDIIGGDLQTRFKYRGVKPNDYGLAPDVVLSKTDKELNRIMPLKKLRTYREDTDAPQPQHGRGKDHASDGRRPKGDGAAAGKHRARRFLKQESATGLAADRLGAYNLKDDQRPPKKRQRT